MQTKAPKPTRATKARKPRPSHFSDCPECKKHGGMYNRYRPYPNPAHIAETLGAGAYRMSCGGTWLD